MRVLVTGATGFIGSRLLRALRARGHDAVGAARDGAPVRVDFARDHAPEDWLPRLAGVDAVVNAVAEERAQRFAGREMEVLVEGPNPRNPAQAMGRTRHNKVTFFPGDGEALKGQLVGVKIEKVMAYTLYGTRVA